jgi:hypothetical protein
MAVIDHHDHATESHDTNRCATMFCLTWVGFFVLIGLVTYLVHLI